MIKLTVTVTESASEIINRVSGHKPSSSSYWHAGNRRCPFLREQAPAILAALEAAAISAEESHNAYVEREKAVGNAYNVRSANKHNPVPGYRDAVLRIKAKLA